MLRVAMRDFAGELPHLAGATRAEELARALSMQAASGETILFDFTGMETVTASFLKALVYPFLEDGKTVDESAKKGIFPFVFGVNDSVREELVCLTELTGRPVMEATRLQGEDVVAARVYGELVPALAATLQELVARSTATATGLHAEGLKRMTVNAWNNRLADLYVRRLARRTLAGKQLIYAPAAKRLEWSTQHG